jgi:hypothetical protein
MNGAVEISEGIEDDKQLSSRSEVPDCNVLTRPLNSAHRLYSLSLREREYIRKYPLILSFSRREKERINKTHHTLFSGLLSK